MSMKEQKAAINQEMQQYREEKKKIQAPLELNHCVFLSFSLFQVFRPLTQSRCALSSSMTAGKDVGVAREPQSAAG